MNIEKRKHQTSAKGHFTVFFIFHPFFRYLFSVILLIIIFCLKKKQVQKHGLTAVHLNTIMIVVTEKIFMLLALLPIILIVSRNWSQESKHGSMNRKTLTLIEIVVQGEKCVVIILR